MRTNCLNDRRRNLGATIILVPVTAILFVLALGVFGYELARSSFAREQLRACCDSAALTAAASLANAGELDTPAKVKVAHELAMNRALEVFRMNYVVNTPLTNTQMVRAVQNSHPGAGEVFLDIDWLDFRGNVVPDLSNQLGRRARVGAKAGLKPAFGIFLGLAPAEIFALSQAGKQRPLDIVLALDNSASMSEESYIRVIKRYLKGDVGGYPYDPPLHHEYHIRSEGLDNGFGINPLPMPPQKMEAGFDPRLRSNDAIEFTQFKAGNINKTGQAIDPDAPPFLNNGFTDVVANLQDPPFLGRKEVQVEASRGNLDNMDAYTKSYCERSGISSNLVGVATKAEYDRQVRDRMRTDPMGRIGNLQPYHAVLEVIHEFCNYMKDHEDCHFALVPFAVIGGNADGTTERVWDKIYSPSYMNELQDNKDEFDVPSVALDLNDDKLSQVLSTIDQLKPMWGTNTADAFVQAKNMLFGPGNQRRGKATPIVIMLTDGIPAPSPPHTQQLNPGLSTRFHGLQSQIINDTLAEATQMGDKGAKCYTVGFFHEGSTQQGEQVLTSIVDAVGNGSQFFLAENVDEVREALLAIQSELSSVQLEDEIGYQTGIPTPQ